MKSPFGKLQVLWHFELLDGGTTCQPAVWSLPIERWCWCAHLSVLLQSFLVCAPRYPRSRAIVLKPQQARDHLEGLYKTDC